MKEEKTRIFEFEHFDKFKVIYYYGSNVIEVKKMVKASWWKRNMDKIPMVYKTIYFGHSTPIEKIVDIVKECQGRND